MPAFHIKLMVVVSVLLAAARGSAADLPPTTSGPAAKDKPQAVPTLDELLLFFPLKFPSGNWEPPGLRFQDVWFKAADETQLHGWYCPCEKPRAIVLFAHGNAGNIAYCSGVLQLLQTKLRVSVFAFDYRGYGRSDGLPTVEGALQDARAARTCLAQQAGVKASEIVLLGHSLGGAISTQLAAESPSRALIIQSTFSSLQDVAAHHYPRLAWLVPPGKLNSVAHIARYHGPVLQSHGDADQLIPFRFAQKLFQAANEPKTFVVLPGGDHNVGFTPEYYRRLDEFLDGLANHPRK